MLDLIRTCWRSTASSMPHSFKSSSTSSGGGSVGSLSALVRYIPNLPSTLEVLIRPRSGLHDEVGKPKKMRVALDLVIALEWLRDERTAKTMTLDPPPHFGKRGRNSPSSDGIRHGLGKSRSHPHRSDMLHLGRMSTANKTSYQAHATDSRQICQHAGQAVSRGETWRYRHTSNTRKGRRIWPDFGFQFRLSACVVPIKAMHDKRARSPRRTVCSPTSNRQKESPNIFQC